MVREYFPMGPRKYADESEEDVERKRKRPRPIEEEEENEKRRTSSRKRRVEYYEDDYDDYDDEEEEEENRDQEDSEQPGPSTQTGHIQGTPDDERNNDLRVLPVTCRNKNGTLDIDKLARGDACIESEGCWFAPPAFESFAGKGSTKKWKSSIFFDDKPLQLLFENDYLKSPGYRKRKAPKKTPSPKSETENSSEETNNKSEDDVEEDDDEDEDWSLYSEGAAEGAAEEEEQGVEGDEGSGEDEDSGYKIKRGNTEGKEIKWYIIPGHEEIVKTSWAEQPRSCLKIPVKRLPVDGRQIYQSSGTEHPAVGHDEPIATGNTNGNPPDWQQPIQSGPATSPLPIKSQTSHLPSSSPNSTLRVCHHHAGSRQNPKKKNGCVRRKQALIHLPCRGCRNRDKIQDQRRERWERVIVNTLRQISHCQHEISRALWQICSQQNTVVELLQRMADTTHKECCYCCVSPTDGMKQKQHCKPCVHAMAQVRTRAMHTAPERKRAADGLSLYTRGRYPAPPRPLPQSLLHPHSGSSKGWGWSGIKLIVIKITGYLFDCKILIITCKTEISLTPSYISIIVTSNEPEHNLRNDKRPCLRI
ncbi:uncharacterized protein ACJ7VT_001049 [Polymixia lowei]